MVELALSAGLAFIVLTLGLSLTPYECTRACRSQRAMTDTIIPLIARRNHIEST